MTHVHTSLRAHAVCMQTLKQQLVAVLLPDLTLDSCPVVHTDGDTYATTSNLPPPLPPTLTHTQALTKAVYGMLPHNNLRKKRMRRLHLYQDEVSQCRTFFVILYLCHVILLHCAIALFPASHPHQLSLLAVKAGGMVCCILQHWGQERLEMRLTPPWLLHTLLYSVMVDCSFSDMFSLSPTRNTPTLPTSSRSQTDHVRYTRDQRTIQTRRQLDFLRL